MAWRNIFYDGRQQVIHLWTWDENGKRIKLVADYEPHLFIESGSATDATSIFNTPLKKITFKNQFDRSKFVNETPIKRIFDNLSCEQDFLLNTYKNDINKLEFGQHPLKIFFLDIETYSPNEFPLPELAKDPINLITFYDTISKKYYSFGTKPYTPKDKDIKYFYFKRETEMLRAFIEFWANDPPDVLCTWNGEGFDVPYIMNRINNLLGEEEAARLSPVQSIYYRENVALNKFGKMINRWYIRGVSNIDYMQVYTTFARGDRESYSLNYIGEYELKEGKISTGGMNLADLSEQDWDTFVDYNIQDVRILVKLDEKLKYIKLIRTLSYKGFIPFEQSLGKVSMITGAVAHQAAMQGYVIPTFKNEGERDAYVGGYVHEPERGLSKAVVSYDANSLYPNTIITLNISPETKIGKITSIEDGQYNIKLANEKTVTLSEEKFNRLVQKEHLSISKYNVLYTQKFKGVIPNLIDRLYKERVEAKNEMIKREKSLSFIKDKAEKLKIEEVILNLDTQQNVYKLVLNSIYGVFAQKYSPLFDIDHSASITLTGQAVVKQAAEIVYNFATKKGYTGDKEKIYLYGDTDSAYFSIQPILSQLGVELVKDGKLTDEAREVAKQIDKYLNTEILVWASDQLKSTDPRFVFKQETICDVGLFLEKKRYILHVLDKEGYTPKDPFKYVGVEVARSSISAGVKELIKNVIELTMLSTDKKKSNEIFKEAYKKFKEMKPEEVSLRSKISDIEKQEAKVDEYGKIGKGTPIHAKAAIYYNDLIKRFNIDNVYESIGSGTKMKYFYASKNPFNYKVMAFLDNYPPELNEQIKVNYQMMFDKIVAPPIQRVYECIGWSLPSMSAEVQTDLFELFS
jgi:DNA polymerase elongation subunit (family B)